MKASFSFELVCLTAAVVGGQIGNCIGQELELSIDPNRFYANARFSFNISASLKSLPIAPSAEPDYYDGFVRPDISGNAGGLTWNWGYQTADQVGDSLPGGALSMHYFASSPRDGTSQTLDSDITAGFEIGYGRQLGLIRLGPNRSAVWGVQGGFGSLDINLDGSSLLKGNASLVEHVYALGGVVPPVAPYTGSFEGPGPLIPTTPASSVTSAVGVTSQQNAQLDALVLGFKVGPFVEVPIYKRLSLHASAGAAIMDALTELKCSETMQIDGTSTILQRTFNYENDEWVFGFYANLALGWSVTDTFTFVLGAQYQGLDDVEVVGADREAKLDLGGSIEVIAGLRMSF